MTFDRRYRLGAKLGAGVMGLVYKARKLDDQRGVAIKVVHPSLAESRDARRRFECEVLAVGRAAHPNCVGMYDSGTLADGTPYLAMELLDGRSLSEVLKTEGRLSPERALRILAHVLRGLAHIHAVRLVHRDINPENIVLIRRGDDPDFAKIVDFGLAKSISATRLDAGVKLKTFGMTFGSPVYSAPEQTARKPIDGRADLYAVSVVAYEMLCGQPPFRGTEPQQLASMHARMAVPPMRDRVPHGGKAVPPIVERVIMRGLAKDPDQRWPDATAYLAEVERALRLLELSTGVARAVEDALAERPEVEPAPTPPPLTQIKTVTRSTVSEQPERRWGRPVVATAMLVTLALVIHSFI
jgi:serine/threonine-protein kinase